MKRIARGFARAIAERAAVDTEFQLAWPSHRQACGEFHHGYIETKITEILRMAGVAWDIAERRQTELTLDKERSLLATLMDTLPYTFYFKD